MPKIRDDISNLVKYQEEFSDETIKRYEGMNTLLISNQRSKDYNADPKTEEEVERNANIIVRNMEDQKRWFYLLKPKYALLRFRPLLSNEAKLIKRSSFNYLTGVHLLLPYSKPKINSTMLFVRHDANQVEAIYFDSDMISRLKYHNVCVRNGTVYLNPFTRVFEALMNIEEIRAIEHLSFDLGSEHYVMNCGWDCRYAYFVFALYLKEIRKATLSRGLINEFILTHFSRLENRIDG
jgi:hypothetical protein